MGRPVRVTGGVPSWVGSLVAVGLLATLTCQGRVAPESASPGESIGVFPIPRVIAVDLTPFGSVEEALAQQGLIDWRTDRASAQAITLAHAARDLREHLALAGVMVELMAAAGAEESAIVLAAFDGTLVTAAGDTIEHGALGAQGYAITPSGRQLYVSAATRIGVQNGVYRLLEELGFDWPGPAETTVPALDASDTVVWPTLREVPRAQRRGFWIHGEQTLQDDFVRWMARNRLNIGGRPRAPLGAMLGILNWQGAHELLQEEFSRPGLFEQHPDWFSLVDGVRRRIEPTGTYFNPAFGNPEAAAWFAARIIERLDHGDLADVDVLNVWPADDRFNAFDQSPLALALGNETDNLLSFYGELCRALREAQGDGRLFRPVTVAGISYFLTMRPPTNESVVAGLVDEDYLHLFYPIERDWAGPIDERLADRDKNREFLEALEDWRARAPLSYGVVEYYNVSTFGGIGLGHAAYLEHDYQVLTAGRPGLFAYMHPLATNAGPRGLTNALLARLAWRSLDGVPHVDGEQITEQWFTRRYGERAARWRDVHERMARSVENAQQLFGMDSLMWVLFQEQLWSEPAYRRDEANSFVQLFRDGGVQELPGGYSARDTIRASFLGLDDAIALQAQATALLQDAMIPPLEDPMRARMLEDLEWFRATAARYRLMAATCDWLLAGDDAAARTNAGDRMEDELDFLETSAVLHDTLSGAGQDAFLELHRNLLGAP